MRTTSIKALFGTTSMACTSNLIRCLAGFAIAIVKAIAVHPCQLNSSTLEMMESPGREDVYNGGLVEEFCRGAQVLGLLKRYVRGFVHAGTFIYSF